MEKEIAITGMTSDYCAGHVEDVFKVISGITAYTVDWQRGLARITGANIDDKQIEDGVAQIGYMVTKIVDKK